ncbi:MAG: BON domain-containing protein [Myxococcales bacterium]
MNELSPAPATSSIRQVHPVGSGDAEIRRRVLQEMQRRPSLDIGLLSIQVGNGVVTLRGEVPSIAELPTLARAIRNIPAVHELRSELKVLRRRPR